MGTLELENVSQALYPGGIDQVLFSVFFRIGLVAIGDCQGNISVNGVRQQPPNRYVQASDILLRQRDLMDFWKVL